MMKSMTGYGKATNEWEQKKITAEIRSLNSRQLDLSLRMPGVFKDKELELRSEISKLVERGKVDLSIYFESNTEPKPVSINKALALAYYKDLKALAMDLDEPLESYLPLLIKMPEVLKAEKQEADENEWPVINKTIIDAITQFNRFREDEGSTLANEFNKRIGIIQTLLTEVESHDANRIQATRDKLKKALIENVEKEKIDQNRFEQELVYYIEKLDITEEKLRLQTHCDYFLKTMDEPATGRKLGFITQEIGREINTIGSKANDAKVQKIVVQMKDELEKIKEQLLNVL